MKKLYFAHPINTYPINTCGTTNANLERELLVLIGEKFPSHEIVNPSEKTHADKVAEMRAKDPSVNVMQYFIGLVQSCDDAVVLPFGDGMWGAGVWTEAKTIQEQGGSVWVIDQKKWRVLFVPNMIEAFKLSIDETRLRIRNADGNTKLYE